MGFADLRTWLERFEAVGELKRVNAVVNWDREMGAIARRSLTSKGPALLFENIRDHQDTACRGLFSSAAEIRSLPR